MKIEYLTLLLLTASVVIAGCCSCPETVHERQFPRTEIHYSSGGGVSGMSSGYSILHDGTVTRWTGRGGSHENAVSIGKIDLEEFHKLLSEIYDLEPANIRQQETANMTTAMEIISNDVVYTYTWSGVHGDDDAVPTVVKPLRDIVWAQLQRVRALKN